MAAILDFVTFRCLKWRIILGSYAKFDQDRLLSPEEKIGAFIRPISFTLKFDAKLPDYIGLERKTISKTFKSRFDVFYWSLPVPITIEFNGIKTKPDQFG